MLSFSAIASNCDCKGINKNVCEIGLPAKKFNYKRKVKIYVKCLSVKK